MKNFLLLSFLAPLFAFGQATPANYPYSKPLPTNGGVARAISTRVSAPIAPNAYDSKVPAVWDNFVGGGHRSVGTLAERNAINAGFRKEGMTVYVAEDGKTYKLGSDLTSWSEAGGSGGGSVPIAAPAHYPGQAGGTSPIVGAATVISPGSGYWPNDYIEVQGGSGTAPSYLVVDSVKLVSLDIDNPGTNYVQGDTLYLTFSGDVNAVLTVDSVGEGGEITSAHFNQDSQYYGWQLAGLTEPESPTAGSGTGFSVTNILFGARTLYVYADGSYTTMPTWPAATTVVWGSSGTGLTVRPWDVGAYEEGDTLTLAGGTTATVESTTISSVIIENGGVGYTEGDLLRGDWAVQSPIFRVSQVDDNGGVLAVEIQNGGRFWSTTLAPGEESPRWQLRDGNELYQLYVDSSPSGLRLIPTYGVYNAAITSAGSFDGVNPVAQTATSGRGAAATFNLLTKDGGRIYATGGVDIDIDPSIYNNYYLMELYDYSYGLLGYDNAARRKMVVAREHSFPVTWAMRFASYGGGAWSDYLYFGSNSDINWAEFVSDGAYWSFSNTFGPDYVSHKQSAFPNDAVFNAFTGHVRLWNGLTTNPGRYEQPYNPDALSSYEGLGWFVKEMTLDVNILDSTPQTILQMDGDSPFNYDIDNFLVTWGGDVTLLRDRINAQKDLRRFAWYNLYYGGALNFSGFDKLEYVGIYDNYLSSVDFTGCTALKELYMDNTPAASNLVLTNLTSLEYVAAESFGYSFGTPGRMLVANNPKLTYLDLNWPGLATNVVITNCPLVDFVDVSYTGYNGEIGASIEIRDIPSCTVLWAGGGLVTNVILSGISHRLTDVFFANQYLSTSNVNDILQIVDGAGGYYGTLDVNNQTPPAPPTGAGLISLTNLINRGWTVLTD